MTRPITSTAGTPSFLLPLSLEDFYKLYWEKQPLHIERNEASQPTLIDLPAIEALLSTQPTYFPGVQLTQSGKDIELNAYVDEHNAIFPLRLFELHRQGATIVLSQAQKLFAPLNDLCREVTRSLKMSCQANVYVSRPAKQGFNAHYDTHDVFIMQVSGVKTFNFYPSPVHLPATDEQFDPGRINADTIEESIRLTAGDTLYIPRGVVHDAVADDTIPSIHITLGVYPVLLRDMLLQAVHRQAARDNRLRKSINPFADGEVASKPAKQQMMTLLQATMDSLDDASTISEIMQGFQDELSLGAQQDCRNVVANLAAWDETSRESFDFNSIELLREQIIYADCADNVVRIHAFGQILEFDESMGTLIKRLLSFGELTRTELEVLGADQRDALVARLLQENLITLV